MSKTRSNRRGAILPLIVLLLPVMLLLASFVVNLAYIELTRTELRIAVDSAARAAGHRFIQTGSKIEAEAAARQAGIRNQVANQNLQFAPEEIEVGTSVRPSENDRYIFASGGARPNAVRVTGNLTTASPNGPVGMVFPTFGLLDHFETTQSAISTQAEIDIALVLDRSGSMAYAVDQSSRDRFPRGAPGWRNCDPAPAESRWLDLVAAVDVFFAELELTRQRERVSLSTYSTSSSHEVDLTEDYSSIRDSIDDFTQRFCGGRTAIGKGLKEGHQAVLDGNSGRNWVGKAIVIMTDGIHNTGLEPTKPARDAFEDGVLVYTITFSEEADISRMRETARVGGGMHFHATSRAELIRAFEEIIKSLPTLLTR